MNHRGHAAQDHDGANGRFHHAHGRAANLVGAAVLAVPAPVAALESVQVQEPAPDLESASGLVLSLAQGLALAAQHQAQAPEGLVQDLVALVGEVPAPE